MMKFILVIATMLLITELSNAQEIMKIHNPESINNTMAINKG